MTVFVSRLLTRTADFAKRLPMARQIYALLFNRHRLDQFQVTRWVNDGVDIVRREQLKAVTFYPDHAAVLLPNGLKFVYLREIEGEGLDSTVYRGTYETATTNLLIDKLGPGSVFFDIGANIGWYSLHIAHLDPSIQVHAFEPGTLAGKYLRNNVEENSLAAQITINHCAVSNTCGQVKMTNNQLGHALNHIVTDSEFGASTTEIPTSTVDDYVTRHNIQRLDLAKCDVEGAELLVLQGAAESLRRFRPTLLLEVNEVWSSRFNYTPRDLVDFLADIGYEWKIIDDDGQLRTGSLAELSKGANVLFSFNNGQHG